MNIIFKKNWPWQNVNMDCLTTTKKCQKNENGMFLNSQCQDNKEHQWLILLLECFNWSWQTKYVIHSITTTREHFFLKYTTKNGKKPSSSAIFTLKVGRHESPTLCPVSSRWIHTRFSKFNIIHPQVPLSSSCTFHLYFSFQNSSTRSPTKPCWHILIFFINSLYLNFEHK